MNEVLVSSLGMFKRETKILLFFYIISIEKTKEKKK